MKQMQNDKHVIAWFKIAEYVSRGEKERALGVYRLLSHSFNDDAVARQLEADIYHSFDEKEQAIVLYRQAVELYHKSRRFLEAAAISEHLITMCPSDSVLRRQIIRMYVPLAMTLKIKMHMRVLIDLFAQQQQWHEMVNLLEDCILFSRGNDCIEMGSDIVINAHKVGCPWDTLSSMIKHMRHSLCAEDEHKNVQSFLSLLQVYSDELYGYALNIIQGDTKL